MISQENSTKEKYSNNISTINSEYHKPRIVQQKEMKKYFISI